MSFSKENISFLTSTVPIDIEGLEEKINDTSENYWEVFNEFTDFIREHTAICEKRCISNDIEPKERELINQEFNKIISKCNIEKGSSIYLVIDVFRHAYVSFCIGGIRDLLKYKEGEEWYPEIVIESIVQPNDIDSLDDTITIYRGTSLIEYELGVFGQYWSLDQSVASKFAFTHYGSSSRSQEKRILLKTTIQKNHLFYYDSDDNEKEVIVNISCLSKEDIQPIKSGYIE